MKIGIMQISGKFYSIVNIALTLIMQIWVRQDLDQEQSNLIKLSKPF